jgi:hypothetical protein
VLRVSGDLLCIALPRVRLQCSLSVQIVRGRCKRYCGGYVQGSGVRGQGERGGDGSFPADLADLRRLWRDLNVQHRTSNVEGGTWGGRGGQGTARPIVREGVVEFCNNQELATKSAFWMLQRSASLESIIDLRTCFYLLSSLTPTHS